MWNQEKAWRYLAERWAKPMQRNDVVFARVMRIDCRGLCEAIEAIGDKLKDDGRDQMRDQLSSSRPLGSTRAYWWPLTMSGAKARAAKCRAMARKAARG
jgi:hypothetical protein